MMRHEPAIDLAGVFVMMSHGSAPGLAIAAVSTEHYHRHVEGMRSKEKARDELMIV
jgi:hypothetical protein